MERQVLIEMRRADTDLPARPSGGGRRRPVIAVAWAAAIAAAIIVVVSAVGRDGERTVPVDSGPARPPPSFARLPELTASQLAPDPARAAACYDAQPTAGHLRTVFEGVGGFDGLQLGTASGAFEVVTFDAVDPDRLVAAQRGSYGPAEHQDVTERWTVDGGLVHQAPWDPTFIHDFVHHNTDGTTTAWVAEAAGDGIAPRRAIVLDRAGGVVTSSAPMFADRFAVDGGTVFALAGGTDEFSPRDSAYGSLLADVGGRRVELAPGAGFAWIDVPAPGLLVAYPAEPGGATAVWDTGSLHPLPEHALAGRDYQRVAVSGDRTMAVGVTADGELEPVDLTSGLAGPRFGSVDVREVDRPIVLNADGTVALTVERSGDVTIWFVGDDRPIASTSAGAGVPRWLPTSRSAARLASALAPDASRVALRIDARPQVGVTWRIVDTDVASWLTRARALDPAPPPLPSDPRIPC